MDTRKNNIILAYLAGVLSMLLVGVLIMAGFLMVQAQTPEETPQPSSNVSPQKTETPAPQPSESSSSQISKPSGEPDNTLIAPAIGMNEAEGVKALQEAGWTVRIVQRDGESFIITADYSTYRANLTIQENIITKAEIY